MKTDHRRNTSFVPHARKHTLPPKFSSPNFPEPMNTLGYRTKVTNRMKLANYVIFR
jgi:hypothetical protein